MKPIAELRGSRMPWKIDDGRVWSDDGWLVHERPYKADDGFIMDSDTRLIAAAPDLYDALVDLIEAETRTDLPAVELARLVAKKVMKARAAIAKASGCE